LGFAVRKVRLAPLACVALLVLPVLLDLLAFVARLDLAASRARWAQLVSRVTPVRKVSREILGPSAPRVLQVLPVPPA